MSQKAKQMLSSLIILVSLFYSCSCDLYSMEPIEDLSVSKYPIRFELFNTDPTYEGHPYRNVNLNIDITHFNAFENLGDKKFYLIEKSLGNGTFGSVFKAIHTPTGDEVALKILDHSFEEQISKEIQVLRAITGAPNFLPLRDVLREKDESGQVIIGLVSDFFKSKSFSEILPKMDAYEVKLITYETMRTLEFAHSKGIMHRDIKPLNVLMNPDTLQVRVIDWGQGEFYVPNKNLSVRVGTLFYKAPELLLGYGKHDYAVDVWSTGCMLAEMAFKTKEHFFHPDAVAFPKNSSTPFLQAQIISKRGQLDAYARVLGTHNLKAYAEKFKDDMVLDILEYAGEYPGVSLTSFINERNSDIVDPLLIDLLYRMLVYDHTKRITMKEALAHPYFDEVRVD